MALGWSNWPGMRRYLCVVVAGFVLSVPALTAQVGAPTAIYVFGDSYSDIGAGYVDGNGPTAAAYFAKGFHLLLVPPQAQTAARQSVDFAVSGAQTGRGKGSRIGGVLLGRGMKDQVEDFALRTKKGELVFSPATTLFLIFGGLNDSKVQTREAIQDIEDEIRTLSDLGGIHFQVALLPEKIPAFHDVAVRLNPAIAGIPAHLKTVLPKADVRLSLWGPHFDAVMDAPSRYGIDNTRERCAGRKIFGEDETPCATPDAHYFYHVDHPSTAVHRIVGEWLYRDYAGQMEQEDKHSPQ